MTDPTFNICQGCKEPFLPRSPKLKFCSKLCQLLWRERRTDQSPAAVARRKKARRNRLNRKWLRNEISPQEFERQRDFWQRYGLWK